MGFKRCLKSLFCCCLPKQDFETEEPGRIIVYNANGVPKRILPTPTGLTPLQRCSGSMLDTRGNRRERNGWGTRPSPPTAYLMSGALPLDTPRSGAAGPGTRRSGAAASVTPRKGDAASVTLRSSSHAKKTRSSDHPQRVSHHQGMRTSMRHTR